MRYTLLRGGIAPYTRRGSLDAQTHMVSQEYLQRGYLDCPSTESKSCRR